MPPTLIHVSGHNATDLRISNKVEQALESAGVSLPPFAFLVFTKEAKARIIPDDFRVQPWPDPPDSFIPLLSVRARLNSQQHSRRAKTVNKTASYTASSKEWFIPLLSSQCRAYFHLKHEHSRATGFVRGRSFPGLVACRSSIKSAGVAHCEPSIPQMAAMRISTSEIALA
jgi:hypothetical protein